MVMRIFGNFIFQINIGIWMIPRLKNIITNVRYPEDEDEINEIEDEYRVWIEEYESVKEKFI